MARRSIVNHSDDDAEEVATSPLPSPTKKKAPKAARRSPSDAEETEIECDEEATTSMDEFIDDRALDELSEHSASAEEGFTDHKAEHRHKTPPFKHVDGPKFPSDTDDEGVEEAENFQADVVESPKKRSVKRQPRQEESDAESDAEEDNAAMDISLVQKKMKKRGSNTDVVVVEDSGLDEVAIVHKKGPSNRKTTALAPAKLETTGKSTPVKKTPKKKPISKETISDTDDDAIAALKLSKDDKMYPETKSVKVQASNLKCGLPITPPLATRAASKKQKVEPVDVDDVEKMPMRKVKKGIDNKQSLAKASSKTSSCKNDENSDDEAPVKAKKTIACKIIYKDGDKDDDDDEALTKKITATCKTACKDDNNEDDEEDEAPVKVSAKKATTRKTTRKEDSDEETPVKVLTQKTTARNNEEETPVKASAKKTTARRSTSKDGNDDEDETPVKASTKKSTARKTKHKVDDKDDDDQTPVKASSKKTTVMRKITHKDNDTDDDDEAEETPVKSSTKKTIVRKTTRKDNDKDEDDNTPVKAPRTKPTAARKTTRKDEDDNDNDSDVPVKASTKKASGPKTPNRKANVAKSEKVCDSAPIDEDDVFGAAKDSSDDGLPDLSKDATFAAALAKPSKKPLFQAPAGSASSNVFDTKPEYGSATQKYSDKIWKALPPPDSCEVYDVNFCDPVLSSVKSYIGMPKLRLCIFENTGARFSGVETGCIFLGKWKQKLPADTFSATVDVIAFSKDGRFVNLSRIAPSRLYTRAMSESRHETAIGDQTAIAVSMICVRESGLTHDLVPNFPYKGVRGVPVTNEGQRIPAMLGEVAHRSTLHTQIWNSAITFNTKTQAAARSGARAVDLPHDFYNTYQSPKKPRSVNASSLPNHVGALEYNERIPVYDARNVEPGFKFSAAVFANPADYFGLFNFDEFPEYDNEIPPNSLCLVGYVTQFYRMPDSASGKDTKGKGKAKATEDIELQELRVNTFICWIFVLGVIN